MRGRIHTADLVPFACSPGAGASVGRPRIFAVPMLLVRLRAARCGALDPRLVDGGAQPNVTARPQALRRAHPGVGTRTASASAFPTTTPLSNRRWSQELPARSPDATARSSNHNTSRSLWIQEEEGEEVRKNLSFILICLIGTLNTSLLIL